MPRRSKIEAAEEREKGETPNELLDRLNQRYREKRQQHRDTDPMYVLFESMLEEREPRDRILAADKLARYTQPPAKPVEVATKETKVTVFIKPRDYSKI